MIGYMSNQVKSKTHSAKNIENRYLRSVATHISGVNGDGGASHMLIDARVLGDKWPAPTRGNTKPVGEEYRSVTNNSRARRVLPMLGPAECDAHPTTACDYTMTWLHAPVTVGGWKYQYKIAEDRRAVHTARSSWFRIRWQDVPHHAEAERALRQDEDDERSRVRLNGRGEAYAPAPGRPSVWHRPEFIYGRIERFAVVTIAQWTDVPYQLAQVDLFEPSPAPRAHTGLHTIDLRSRLCRKTPGGRASIEFVQVKHLDACIAVGKTTTDTPHVLVVMHIPR